jgi:hypothetical protein
MNFLGRFGSAEPQKQQQVNQTPLTPPPTSPTPYAEPLRDRASQPVPEFRTQQDSQDDFKRSVVEFMEDNIPEKYHKWTFGGVGAAIGWAAAFALARKHIEPLQTIYYFTVPALCAGGAAYYIPKQLGPLYTDNDKYNNRRNYR